ncbi:MAG TPA: hypothetical protein PLT87_02495 [Spirochaetales bacterium]|nr:hypothetical protein [Spirochaetales bacterium]
MRRTSNQLRLLVAVKNNSSSNLQTESDEKYKRMKGVYSECGFEVSLATVNDLESLELVTAQFMPDLVLCGIDHLPSKISKNEQDKAEQHNVHRWFEGHAINYIGSDPATIERVLSKVSLKQVWKGKGIQTPVFGLVLESATANERQEVIEELVALDKFPYILKPNNLGNSLGIDEKSVVWNGRQLSEALDRLLEFERGDILVEHYLGVYQDFEEVTCAMIEGPKGMVLMPCRLSLAQPGVYPIITTSDKDNHRTVLTRLDAEKTRAFLPFAHQAFSVSGVRDYARGDFIYANGVFWAIEINGQPMIPDRWFENASSLNGLSESQYLVGIVAAGYRRLRAQGLIDVDFPQDAKTLLQGTALACQ